MVTGTGPHSGDRDVHRYPFDPRSISWLHADLVMLFLGLSVGIYVAVLVLARGTTAPRAWLTVILVAGAQGLIGYAQYFTGLPEVLVLLHMLGACLLVIAVTWGVLSLRVREPA